MSPLVAAQGYVRRLGLYVFPVAHDGRTPIKVEGRFENGCHDATNDLDEVEWRWRRFPHANVALACGLRSGVFALDIDAKDGKENGFESLARLEALHGPLPRSWRSLTPSSGEHRFFRQPLGWTLRNKVGLRTYDSRGRVEEKYLGLDIRTDGGSVALPPSRKPNGSYRWADHPLEVPLADPPDWLLKLAMDPPAPPKADRRPLRKDTAARMARYVEAALDGECGEISKQKEGGRNQRLYTGAIRLGELVGAKLLPERLAEDELYAAAQACGLVGDDGVHAVRITITSGLRKGISQPREVDA
jgi:putative DNA primase/helicase